MNYYDNKIKNVNFDYNKIKKNFEIYIIYNEKEFSSFYEKQKKDIVYYSIQKDNGKNIYYLFTNKNINIFNLRKEIKDCKKITDFIADEKYTNILLNLILHEKYKIKTPFINEIIDKKGKYIITLSIYIKNPENTINVDVKTFKAYNGEKKVKRYYKKGLNYIEVALTKKECTHFLKSNGRNEVILANLENINNAATKINKYIEVKDILENSEYIKNIEYEEINLSTFKTKQALKTIINSEKIKKIAKELNIKIYYNDIEKLKCIVEAEKPIKKVLEEYNILITDKIDKNTLVVLEKDAGDEDSDEIYNNTTDTQHILFENIKNVNSLINCLHRMVAINEIKSNKIKTFPPIENPLTFYKKTEDEETSEILYHKLRVEKDLHFEYQCSKMRFDEMSHFGSKYYGQVSKDNGSYILIKNTNKFILPDAEFLKAEIDNQTQIQMYEKSGTEWYNFLYEIIYDTDIKSEIKNEVRNFIDEYPNIISGSCKERIKWKDKIFKKMSKNTKTVIKEKIKNCEGIDLENHIKAKPEFSYIKNIMYNDKYYLVPDTFNPKQKIRNNILLKEYEYNDENFIEEILVLLMNPIIRYKQTTVIPFFFGYLKEIIERQKHT